MDHSRINALALHIHAGARCHLIGIGGVSMAPLAEVLLGLGLELTGSDISESAVVDSLTAKGIRVAIGHAAENVEGAEFVIRTAAAHDDNVEIVRARELGIPVFERAEAWGCLMRGYKNALCVSGTHGKTTVTSMCTHILMAADRDPTVMIGGTLPLLHSGYRVGKGDAIVLESCEYYNSFLSFFPTEAVILDIEADHLDFFKDLDDIKASFRRFALLTPEDRGVVIANRDDPNVMDVVDGIGRRVVTFGLHDDADITAHNVVRRRDGTDFDLVRGGEKLAAVSLFVPGEHNLKNALAAAAACLTLGVTPGAVAAGLKRFTGAARRFERKGTMGGIPVYDDYAHHPGELHALLDMALALGYERVLVAFQPHTYSRTKALFDDFAAELARPDKTYLAEIYAARETNTEGISSADLAAQVPGAVFCESFEELEDRLRADARPGDLIITVGAGNIYKVGEALVD